MKIFKYIFFIMASLFIVSCGDNGNDDKSEGGDFSTLTPTQHKQNFEKSILSVLNSIKPEEQAKAINGLMIAAYTIENSSLFGESFGPEELIKTVKNIAADHQSGDFLLLAAGLSSKGEPAYNPTAELNGIYTFSATKMDYEKTGSADYIQFIYPLEIDGSSVKNLCTLTIKTVYPSDLNSSMIIDNVIIPENVDITLAINSIDRMNNISPNVEGMRLILTNSITTKGAVKGSLTIGSQTLELNAQMSTNMADIAANLSLSTTSGNSILSTDINASFSGPIANLPSMEDGVNYVNAKMYFDNLVINCDVDVKTLNKELNDLDNSVNHYTEYYTKEYNENYSNISNKYSNLNISYNNSQNDLMATFKSVVYLESDYNSEKYYDTKYVAEFKDGSTMEVEYMERDEFQKEFGSILTALAKLQAAYDNILPR